MRKITVHNPNNLPTIDYRKLHILQGNLKTLSEENLRKLCDSILKHGYFVPAFVWRSDDLWILDATQRYHALEALEKQGYVVPEIPYIEIEAKDKKDAAEKLLQITSRYGTINEDTSFFEDFNIDLSFINEIEIPELNIKLDELEPDIEEDEVPEPPAEPISKTGELWLCGKHRVLCGDSTKSEDVQRLMDGKKADMVFTDPPYGISIVSSGKIGGDGPTKFGKIGGGNWVASKTYPAIRNDENTDVAKKAIMNLFQIKNKIIFGGNYFTNFFPPSRCWIVWDKENTGNFADAELAWTSFDKGVKLYKWLWNGLSRKGKREIEGLSRFHPTQKPVGLFGKIISDFTESNIIIIDAFLGSGTTLIACEQLNRICYSCEIAPQYIDVILDRYAKFTSNDPIREDGVKWSELHKTSQ